VGGFLAELSSVERLFFACAVVGGTIFLVRTLMTLIGGFANGELDGADPSDISGEADASFRALSLQGITAFFMMFGLVGLALMRQSRMGTILAVLGGLLAGVMTVWIIGRIFSGMMKLHADGTLRYENAIGQEGTVYLTIPAQGKGQVSVPIQQQLRMCDAISADKEQIKTGERVIVVDVNNNVLVVSKIS
jgi:membrane-bound ClpP family serine protease